jgi:hypothetical protein
MRKIVRRIMFMLVILLSGVVVWVVYCRWPSPPSNLLSRATKVTNVQDLLSYNWLSSSELLVKTNTNGFPVMRSPWSGNLDLIDIRTHARTRQTGLTAAITRHKSHYNYIGPWSFTRSPDGQYLRWVRVDPIDGGVYPVTARPDGSGYREWYVSADADHYWVDGHRWASNVKRKQVRYVIVHDAAQPHADQVWPASSAQAQALLKLANSHQSYPFFPGDVDLSSERSMLNDSRVKLTIGTRPVGSLPHTPLKQIDTLTFPAGTQVYNNIPNPQMTRIEILVSETSVPPFETLIGHLFPSLSHLAHPVERLCVYRVDKKQLYEIGRVAKTSTTLPDVMNAWWLPDGKHIQFLYKNAVYFVSAD